jgi:hypothetical protein
LAGDFFRQQGTSIFLFDVFRAKRGKRQTKGEQYRSAEGEKVPPA